MKLTRRGVAVVEACKAALMAVLIVAAFVLEAWLFGGAL